MEKLTNIIESILFVNGKAVAIKDISSQLGLADKDVLKAAKELQKTYSSPCGINLLIFNGKLQFASNPEYVEQVSVVLNPIRERELSRSMLETAAIIAYKQPVTRLDLEEIRGVNSEYAVQTLLKLGIIEIVGRKDAVGRPVLFGTTDEFLKRFQISSIDELPDYDELMSRIKVINGTADGDAYLFKKDEYVEGEERPTEVDYKDIKTAAEAKGEVSIGDITQEEIPDFLDGEEYGVFSGDDDYSEPVDDDTENNS